MDEPTAPRTDTGADRPAVDPGDLEPGAEIVVKGRTLTVNQVLPSRRGFDIAPTCGAPVHYDPEVDGPITFR